MPGPSQYFDQEPKGTTMTVHPYEDDRGPGGQLTPEQKLAQSRERTRAQGRAPQRPAFPDHQPAAKKMTAYGMKPVSIEFEGRVYDVIPTVLDDWELVERQVNGEMDPMSLPQQYVEMLGAEGYAELKEHVREIHGYVSARVLGGFMQAVQEQLDGGNS